MHISSEMELFHHDLCEDTERDESIVKAEKRVAQKEDSREIDWCTLKLMGVIKNVDQIRPGVYKHLIFGCIDEKQIEAVCALKCGLTDDNLIKISKALRNTTLDFHQPLNFQMKLYPADFCLLQPIHIETIASRILVENTVLKIKTPRLKVTKETAMTKGELLKRCSECWWTRFKWRKTIEYVFSIKR